MSYQRGIHIDFNLDPELQVYEDEVTIQDAPYGYQSRLVTIKEPEPARYFALQVPIGDETATPGSVESAKHWLTSLDRLPPAPFKPSYRSRDKGLLYAVFTARERYESWKVLECDYCGGDGRAQISIALRPITVIKRPPDGARDLRVVAQILVAHRYVSGEITCARCGRKHIVQRAP